MVTKTLKELFDRDLNQVRVELELYRHEPAIWKTAGAISNSAGNLALHLVGNLNTYIGAVLAKTSYTRQRDLEFSLKDIPRSVLVAQLEETRKIVAAGLGEVTEKMLPEYFPVKIWQEEKSIDYTLIRLAAHLNYHLGQINYHRRLLDNEPT